MPGSPPFRRAYRDWVPPGRLTLTRGCLDLDLGAVLDQGDHLHQRHRREIPAQVFAIDPPQILETVQIGALVGDIPRHPGQMLGPGAGLGQNRDDIGQRLIDLAQEIVGFELLRGVPADQPPQEDHPPPRGDAVRVARRGFPGLRMKDLVCTHVAAPNT